MHSQWEKSKWLKNVIIGDTIKHKQFDLCTIEKIGQNAFILKTTSGAIKSEQ